MKKRLLVRARIAVMSTALLVAGGAVANAFVLQSPVDKDAIANRNDVFAQSTKFSSCLVKATQTCEKGQDPVTQQCAFTGSLVGPTTSFTGLDPKSKGIGAKFEAAVQKCISKVNFSKKGTKDTTPAQKYAAIGCPGDCDSGTGGNQACADMTEYQAVSLAGTITQVGLLAGALPPATIATGETDLGGCVPPSSGDPLIFAKEAKDFDKCVTKVISVVAKYAAALQKCAAGCEADYKNKKGDGGPNDGPPTCNITAISDPADPFAVCVQKATDKAQKKPLPESITAAVPLVGLFLDQGTNNLFNQPDNCPL